MELAVLVQVHHNTTHASESDHYELTSYSSLHIVVGSQVENRKGRSRFVFVYMIRISIF